MGRRIDTRVRALNTPIGIWLVCSCLAILSEAAGAHHPEDTCPDIHADGGESLTGLIVHQDTWEEYPDGAHLPINTPLRATGRGTAFGHCISRVWSGTCIDGPTHQTDFVGLNTWQTVKNSQQNQENHIGAVHWPGAPRQEVDGVAEQTTADFYCTAVMFSSRSERTFRKARTDCDSCRAE